MAVVMNVVLGLSDRRQGLGVAAIRARAAPSRRSPAAHPPTAPQPADRSTRPRSPAAAAKQARLAASARPGRAHAHHHRSPVAVPGCRNAYVLATVPIPVARRPPHAAETARPRLRCPAGAFTGLQARCNPRGAQCPHHTPKRGPAMHPHSPSSSPKSTSPTCTEPPTTTASCTHRHQQPRRPRTPPRRRRAGPVPALAPPPPGLNASVARER